MRILLIACPRGVECWPLSQRLRLERADHWEDARLMLNEGEFSGLVVGAQRRPEHCSEVLPPIVDFHTFRRLRGLPDTSLLGVWLEAVAEHQRLERAVHSQTQHLAALQLSVAGLAKESDENLQLFQGSPTASLILCRNGSILEVNRQAMELLGRSERELLGLPVLICIKEGWVASLLELFWACLRGETNGPIRVMIRRKEGDTKKVEVNARASQIGGTQRLDISLRELFESPFEEQAPAILDRLTDGLLSVDEAGQVLESNKRAQELLGHSRSELAGLSLKELGISCKPRKEAKSLWLSHPSGSRVIVEVKSFGGAGLEHDRRVIGLRDLSARRKALRELMEIRESQLADLGQELHDDLGQVLTALTYLAEILSNNLHTKPALVSMADEVVQLARQSVRKTRSLARSLFPAVLERNGLASALQDLASSTEEAFHIQCECRASQLKLARDQKLHLFRIAQAAINNSVQHSGATRILLKLAKQDKDHVSLEIQDDGKGMVGPFGHKGNGILDMEHRCEALQGSLSIESQPGQGTKLTCRFPFRPRNPGE